MDYQSKFNCAICLTEAKSPVVTSCGHLFCWSCLYQWLNNKELCPVCKGHVTQEKVTPIFTQENQKDPRAEQIPRRPQARREQEQNQQSWYDGFFPSNQNQFNMFFGFFPFTTLGFSWNIGGQNSSRGTYQNQNPEIGKMVLMFTVGSFLWLVYNLFFENNFANVVY